MPTKTEDAQIRAKGKTSKLIRNWRQGTKRQKQPTEKCLCLMALSKIFLQCVNIFERSSKQLKHSYFPFDKLKHAFQIWLQSPEGSSDRRCTSFRPVLYEYTMPPKTRNCQKDTFFLFKNGITHLYHPATGFLHSPWHFRDLLFIIRWSTSSIPLNHSCSVFPTFWTESHNTRSILYGDPVHAWWTCKTETESLPKYQPALCTRLSWFSSFALPRNPLRWFSWSPRVWAAQVVFSPQQTHTYLFIHLTDGWMLPLSPISSHYNNVPWTLHTDVNVSLGQIPRSGATGSWDMGIRNFTRISQTAFQSHCIHLLPPRMYKKYLSFTPSLTQYSLKSFHLFQSDRWKCHFTVVLICMFYWKFVHLFKSRLSFFSCEFLSLSFVPLSQQSFISKSSSHIKKISSSYHICCTYFFSQIITYLSVF